jgi:hypothetical protein
MKFSSDGEGVELAKITIESSSVIDDAISTQVFGALRENQFDA